MWFFRVKWIFYHFISSGTALIVCGFALSALFPGLICSPNSTATALSILGLVLVISMSSATIGGFLSTKEIRQRLEQISLGAKNLAYGNLDYRLGFTGNSDFDTIIEAFNEMAIRLESQVGALQKLAEENEQLLQETKVTAISEERQRLARDLHDAISQQLFAISLMASTASKISANKPDQALRLVQEIAQSASRAQSEMRALLLQLRPLILQNENLQQALKSLASELESRQTIKCDLDLDSVQLPKNMENQLFRITQEALSNVLRHAEATQVSIALKSSKTPSRVLLIIEDNGQGFMPDNAPQSTFGLRSIKERATLLGGTAQWLSVPQKGTKIEIRIPISTESIPGSD